jgi:PAS domain S-box-containing protein
MPVLTITPNQLGTFDVNHQTGARHWSEQMKHLFGLSPDAEVEFDTVLQVLHPDDRRALLDAVADSLRPDGPEHFALEYRVRWPDGSIHWLFVMARTQHSDGPDQRPLCTIGLATDITRAKEAELAEEWTMA